MLCLCETYLLLLFYVAVKQSLASDDLPLASTKYVVVSEVSPVMILDLPLTLTFTLDLAWRYCTGVMLLQRQDTRVSTRGGHCRHHRQHRPGGAQRMGEGRIVWKHAWLSRTYSTVLQNVCSSLAF